MALEAAAVALLLVLLARTGRPRGRVVLYAWHPVAIVEIASSGHLEPLTLVFMLSALLLWDRRRSLGAGAARAVAALVKFVPVLLGPFFLRRLGWRFVLAFGATVALLYAPYLGAGWAVLGSLSAFAGERFGSGPFRWLVGLGAPDWAARGLLLGALAAAVGVSFARPPRDLVGACRQSALLFGAVLLASAYALPWYVLWILPLLCVAPIPALLWASGTISIFYLALPQHPVASQEAISAIVWGPTLALLGAGAIRSWWSRSAAGAEAAVARDGERA